MILRTEIGVTTDISIRKTPVSKEGIAMEKFEPKSFMEEVRSGIDRAYIYKVRNDVLIDLLTCNEDGVFIILRRKNSRWASNGIDRVTEWSETFTMRWYEGEYTFMIGDATIIEAPVCPAWEEEEKPSDAFLRTLYHFTQYVEFDGACHCQWAWRDNHRNLPQGIYLREKPVIVSTEVEAAEAIEAIFEEVDISYWSNRKSVKGDLDLLVSLVTSGYFFDCGTLDILRAALIAHIEDDLSKEMAPEFRKDYHLSG